MLTTTMRFLVAKGYLPTQISLHYVKDFLTGHITDGSTKMLPT